MSSMRSASSSTRYSTPVELGVRRLEVIEQPARRGDDHVHAAAEGVLLRAHADAAVDRGAGQRRVHGERVEVLEDLRRQLARRRQHQRARRPARLARSAGAGSAAETPRSCRCRSARRRARRGPDIAGRNRLGLNRRRPREAELADSFQQIGMEAERGRRASERSYCVHTSRFTVRGSCSVRRSTHVIRAIPNQRERRESRETRSRHGQCVIA